MLIDLNPVASWQLWLALAKFKGAMDEQGVRVDPDLVRLAEWARVRAVGRDGTKPEGALGVPTARMLLTLDETAKVLRVSKRTVQTRTADGLLPATRQGGRTFYHRDDINAYIEGARNG